MAEKLFRCEIESYFAQCTIIEGIGVENEKIRNTWQMNRNGKKIGNHIASGRDSRKELKVIESERKKTKTQQQTLCQKQDIEKKNYVQTT